MDDEAHDCGERKASGKMNIDEVYNGPMDFDANDPEVEHGRPVCNAAVFSFLTNIYHQRQAMRQTVPIPEHVTKTLMHVKNALLISPVSFTQDDHMIGPDDFVEKWASKEQQRVAIGREVVKMVPDRKGNRYKRKFYVGQGPDLAPNAAAAREGEILSLNNDMEPFEIAQFVNLFPESAEEAKSLIPTLERFADKELHYYRDELTRFDRNSFSERRQDQENPNKRMKVVSFANKTLETAMDEMKQIVKQEDDRDPAAATPGSRAGSTPGTHQQTPGTAPLTPAGASPDLFGMPGQYEGHGQQGGMQTNVPTPIGFAPPQQDFDDGMDVVEQAPRSPGMHNMFAQDDMPAPRSPGMMPDVQMQHMDMGVPPMVDQDDDDELFVAPRSPAPMAPRHIKEEH